MKKRPASEGVEADVAPPPLRCAVPGVDNPSRDKDEPGDKVSWMQITHTRIFLRGAGRIFFSDIPFHRMSVTGCFDS